ncbi:hypothetical protein BMS3Bbin09_01203 [bacterium BMS3Bbin09]|nr:hypothetical protein BMS3Bbin09_01203 [bacterium BMS3Bbin09]
MIEIGERVFVIAAFGRSIRLKPLRFTWSDRQINIKDVTYEWTTSEGTSKLLHFSVTDGNTLYELSFNTNSILWMLEGVETDA